jgi:hypothetical protein
VLVKVKAVPRVVVRRAPAPHRVRVARAVPVATLVPTAVSSVRIVVSARIVATGPIVPATTALIVPIVGRVPTVAATVCRRVVSPSR